jgi:heptaprenyl diphosphate synthase
MRIGLANLPLLIALASPDFIRRPHKTRRPSGSATVRPAPFFSAGEFFLLALIKAVGQAMVTGTLFSYVFVFSLAGTALSAAIMYLCRLAAGRRISLAGIGIAGAFASNAAQLVLARFLVFGEAARYLAPPFLAAGIASGASLGLFAETFAARSRWLWLRHGGVSAPDTPAMDTLPAAMDPPPLAAPDTPAAPTPQRLPVFSVKGAAFLILGLAFLFLPQLPVRGGLFVAFWFAAVLGGKKTRPLFTILGFAAIMICNLFPPFGKILWSAGPLLITEGSLLQGLQRAVTMEGLMMFSRLVPGSALPLPGKPGRLLRESLAILEELNKTGLAAKKPGKTRTRFFHNLDQLLCRLSAGAR